MASGLAAACQASVCDTAPDSNPASDYAAGKVSDGGVYQSSEIEERHINFGAGAQVRVRHGLGGRPRLLELWVAHSATGVHEGNEVVPAGDMAQVLCVNDVFVLVRNNTCDQTYLRVVAASPEAPRVVDGGLDDTCP